jgi:hypothetical protein
MKLQIIHAKPKSAAYIYRLPKLLAISPLAKLPKALNLQGNIKRGYFFLIS